MSRKELFKHTGADTPEEGNRLHRPLTLALIQLIVFSCFTFQGKLCAADTGQAEQVSREESYASDLQDDEEWMNEELAPGIYDPLEPVNRVFFVFNDKLYFWFLKPVAQGYKVVIPKPARIGVRNFFSNLLFPIRFVNNVLQGKFKKSGVEAGRFLMNTTMGVVGFGDPAKSRFGLAAYKEDFGQTLGVYGMGELIYICWPLLGPSNVRDTIGLAGDYVLNPLTYLAKSDAVAGVAVGAESRINDISLSIGEYEGFVEQSFDPYIAVRDAYQQHRKNSIKE